MTKGFIPAYLKLLLNGELETRAQEAKVMLKKCVGCAWECKVDRTTGQLGS